MNTASAKTGTAQSCEPGVDIVEAQSLMAQAPADDTD